MPRIIFKGKIDPDFLAYGYDFIEEWAAATPTEHDIKELVRLKKLCGSMPVAINHLKVGCQCIKCNEYHDAVFHLSQASAHVQESGKDYYVCRRVKEAAQRGLDGLH